MNTSEKLDFLVSHKAEYLMPKKPALLEIGPANYLCIQGLGKPGDARFEAHIGALYGMAFTIKMTRKAAGLGDYAICKLECLTLAMTEDPREPWHWQLLIRTPEFVKQADLVAASKKLDQRQPGPPYMEVSMTQLHEGSCVQFLHVGPYSEECKSFAAMEAFAQSKGLQVKGPPHEIYISDPRRVEPAKLKTLLRLPVEKAPSRSRA